MRGESINAERVRESAQTVHDQIVSIFCQRRHPPFLIYPCAAAAVVVGATEYYGTMVKLLSRAHLSIRRPSLPLPPPPLLPLFVRTSLSLSIRVIRTVLAGLLRDATRHDGRGKVGLRETHPENIAGLIPVHGTDHAGKLHRENAGIRTYRQISS